MFRSLQESTGSERLFSQIASGACGYSAEEMDLLKCIGEQVAASLLQLRLTEEIMERKELEAFQTMSTFLIHDLKNAASTLGLMLENLPTHFEQPRVPRGRIAWNWECRPAGSTILSTA